MLERAGVQGGEGKGAVKIEVISLGSHLPLSSRRIVEWLGKSAKHETAIGLIEGLADGAILIRRRLHDGGLEDSGIEITAEQARELVRALNHAAGAVERWQERASGFDAIRIYRSADGRVEVEHRGRRRPMRLSVLRARTYFVGGEWAVGRRCGNCNQIAPTLWIAADDLREHGLRVPHVEVCPGCVDKYANAPTTIAEVTSLEREGCPIIGGTP